jgi:hypothetical protein
MKLLLDTHTFLWFINDSPQLSINAKNLIEMVGFLLQFKMGFLFCKKFNTSCKVLPQK